jgi:hypothetical protein
MRVRDISKDDEANQQPREFCARHGFLTFLIGVPPFNNNIARLFFSGFDASQFEGRPLAGQIRPRAKFNARPEICRLHTKRTLKEDAWLMSAIGTNRAFRADPR